MAAMRESSFLPTIKCSSCGRNVEISLMGEHICGGPGGVGGRGEPSPPPDMPGSFSSSYNDPLPPPPPPEKYGGRLPPPSLDTSAANRTYMRQGQLTPVSSSSGSRSISPKTPDGRLGTAGRGAAGDDYFAPKIASDYESTPPPSRRQAGGRYGGYGESDGFENELYPANSPKKQAPSLLSRMNTIAPGPFEMNRRPAGGASRNAFARNNSDDSSNDYLSRDRFGSVSDRPGTSASNNSMGSNNGGSNSAAPRLPRKDGYGGFGPPQRDDYEPEPYTAISRTGTFPRPSDPVEAPMRTPSAPGPRPDRLRRPSNTSLNRRPSFGMGPDTSRAPPPRTSLVRPRTSGKDSSSINLAQEFGIGNPFHTPSDSMSSSYSTFSSNGQAPSQPSSRTSPARSRSGRDRERTDTSGFDSLMNDLQSSMTASGMDTRPKDLPPTPQQPPPFDKGLGPAMSLRSRSRDRRAPPPSELRLDQKRQEQGRFGAQRSPLVTPQYDLPREMDDRGYRGNNGQGGRWNESPQRSLSPPRQRNRSPGNLQAAATPSARRSCKSCGDAITGKSISSADGRLTGRYHKACFVCTTCREPFSSAEFYVLGDRPYCELHYHQLNGSLCGGCGRGIEGQYLEDETLTKYHVGCFRCADCGMSLSAGYFEVDGKAYCERDAWKLVQPQPWAPSGPAGTDVDLAGPMSSGPGSSPLSLPPQTPGGMSDAGRRTPAPMGLPSRPGSRRPSISNTAGGNASGGSRQPVGLPRGERLAPGMGPTPRPRMNKRMTRLGMM